MDYGYSLTVYNGFNFKTQNLAASRDYSICEEYSWNQMYVHENWAKTIILCKYQIFLKFLFRAHKIFIILV